MEKTAHNCANKSLNYLKCCHGGHLKCCHGGHFFCLVLMAMKMPRHSFGFVMEQILSGQTGNTFCHFDLPLKDGRLQTGDHILQIGGTNVQGMTSEQVAQVLRNCGNSVRMIVARDPKCEVMEAPPTPLSWPVSTLPSLQNGNVSTCCFLVTFLSVFVA